MWKVLFVDDDEEDMFLFDKAMNMINQKSEIDYAVCGDDLFYFIKIRKPDLLFLDISLPGLNGIECLQKIRLEDKELAIPIIIYSAFTSHQLVDACYNEKVNYFVIKPKEFEKVISVLKKVFSIDWVREPFPTREAFVFQ